MRWVFITRKHWALQIRVVPVRVQMALGIANKNSGALWSFWLHFVHVGLRHHKFGTAIIIANNGMLVWRTARQNSFIQKIAEQLEWSRSKKKVNVAQGNHAKHACFFLVSQLVFTVSKESENYKEDSR